MISDGLIITATGMLVVFTFLALMVVATRLMSALVQRYEPAEPPPAHARAARDDDAALAVAIAVAYAHRAGPAHDTRS